MLNERPEAQKAEHSRVIWSPLHQAENSADRLSSSLSCTLLGLPCYRVLATPLEGTSPHTYTTEGFRESALLHSAMDAVWGGGHSLVGYFALQKIKIKKDLNVLSPSFLLFSSFSKIK